jgi:D-alanyl-D-alanine carboxypeptidase (penicillin-binding protein 5/6)
MDSRALQLRERRLQARAAGEARAQARRRMAASFGALGLATVVALVWSIAGSGGGRPGSQAKGRTAAAIAQFSLPRLVVSRSFTDPSAGAIPALPFPRKGEGAVAIMGSGTIAASKNENEVPIASVTKVMTAYLTLLAHPLHGTENGPIFHFTAADHRAWIKASESNDSNVELVSGETLTERQMLEALLIPSADNVADILARWVGGTEARFVARMNAMAASLGMAHTHYADASGVDPKSVSTAADQALLATVVMGDPVFRQIVAMQSAPFPIAGHIWNYNPVLGSDGIVGVKSGFTEAAAGCLVAAAWERVGSRRALVISAITGQPWGLWQAGTGDIALLKAAAARLQLVSPFGNVSEVAEVTVPWSHEKVGASIPAPVRLAGWPGLHVSTKLIGAQVTESNIRSGWAAGSRIATLEVRSQFGPVASYPVTLDRAIAAPPAGSVVLRSPVSLGVGR